jgi:hypothetical protein
VACPPDAKTPNGTVCGGAAGICATVPTCDGSSATCPSSTPLPGGVCRPSIGRSDPTESCNGSSYSCPANVIYQNFVSNPEFESALSGWTYANVDTTTTVDSGSALSGVHSIKMVTPGGYDYYLSQSLNLYSGTLFKLAFLGKTNIPHTMEVSVSGSNGLYETFNVDLTTTQQQFGPFSFNTGGDTTVTLGVQAALNGSSTYQVWLDRFEVWFEN